MTGCDPGPIIAPERGVSLYGRVTASHIEWHKRRRWRWLPWPTELVPVVVIEAVVVDRVVLDADLGAEPGKPS